MFNRDRCALSGPGFLPAFLTGSMPFSLWEAWLVVLRHGSRKEGWSYRGLLLCQEGKEEGCHTVRTEILEREKCPARHVDEELHICCQVVWLQLFSSPCSGSCARWVVQKWQLNDLHYPQPKKPKGVVKVLAHRSCVCDLV